MIRQVITCDICGSQKRQTNHWFVAWEESGELRITGWNSLHLLSPEKKHLCGETCAHKLISHFLPRLVEAGTQRSAYNSGTTAAPETRISARADRTAPSHSTWQGSPSPQGSPESPDHARLERSHRCCGMNRS